MTDVWQGDETLRRTMAQTTHRLAREAGQWVSWEEILLSLQRTNEYDALAGGSGQAVYATPSGVQRALSALSFGESGFTVAVDDVQRLAMLVGDLGQVEGGCR